RDVVHDQVELAAQSDPRVVRGTVEPVRSGLREMESLASPPLPGFRPDVIAAKSGEGSHVPFFEHVVRAMKPERLGLAFLPLSPYDYYESTKSRPAASCVGGPAWSKAQGSESCPVGVRRFKSCPTHLVETGCGRCHPAPLL